MFVAFCAVVVPIPASADTGDVGVAGPSHSGTGTPTGTKRATSVLWFNDGSWWGNLWDSATSDFHIFRFNAGTSSWVDTGMATDGRADTHHDVLWDGKTLYVASYKFVDDELPAEPNFPSTMRRYSYDSDTGKYTLLGSSQINNSKVEVLTIDKDSTGRVWSSWQEDNRIYLNVTATDGKTWGTPFQVPGSMSNVSVDDTSAVIAFDGKIGVMWSRQVGDSTDGMYWSYHVDGASNTAWSTPEAAVSGQRSSDDHMNLKWLDSSGGRVFAAIKTSYTSASQPLIQLLALSGTTWSAHTIATVAECPNRVIVMIDESTQKLRTFATYPKPSGTADAGVCTSSGGAVYEKSTPLDKISFTTTKTARIVDADQFVHNVTSTKQNVNSAAWGTVDSGLLLLADVNATSQYWHYYDPTGGGSDITAPTVTATSPAAGATGVAVTANVTGTFSEGIDASTVTSGTFTLTNGTTPVTATVSYGVSGKVAALDPGADLAAATEYTATIKGGTSGVKDIAGNALAADKTWTFTTAAPPPAQTPIAEKAASLNGALGSATTAEVYGLKDNGAYQCFERGCILWSPATGAHVSTGPIRGLWAATGYENGRLGYPVTDVVGGLRDGGSFQNYQGGAIIWSPATGAHVSTGPIRGSWAATGYENGRLGYPVTDEIGGLRDGGSFQNYQGGAIIWSPATGAHVSTGPIRGSWAATGYENGRLGYPVTDEIGGLKDGGSFQNYQGGAIMWSPATGAHISVGAIRTIWASTGFESGRLGYPTSDEYKTGNDGSVAQNYQGGIIHVSPGGAYISWS
ncbi:LGFP repeat-containing protein [Arthrobacter sp. SLBN-112]|uniref:Ig-like domain-containing protein n=1 Tax=Arthrobacter sp. SLBN-112 TaxID=2768452 RepID=UPI0011714A65|nr:Ig-like domain-containing protein [Arthrobacter sp. SLBN-112]TQJ40912.1 LGFP repeat-containing protein [Arthrobacter sp. SLBN-112]